MLNGKLFYSNDLKSFFGELDFSLPVEELKPERRDHLLGPFTPQFYIKRTLTGAKKDLPAIEFGLVTEESLKKSIHPRDHRDEIPIAWLPEILFFRYTHPGDDGYGKLKKIERQTVAQLTEFGWTQKERDPEDSWLNWPFEINHKYVQVKYRGIS